MGKILVTGGSGYIGSHTLIDLLESGYQVLSIDNHSHSTPEALKGVEQISGKQIANYPYDLCDLAKLQSVFQQHPDIEGIIHFAAYKSVPESVAQPLKYFRNNLISLLNLLQCVEDYKLPYFVFSSSCSVYGNVEQLPVTEDSPLPEPECPYARTKRMSEEILQDFVVAHPDKRVVALRYFNPVGAHKSAIIGEYPLEAPANLIPRITGTAIGKFEELIVAGDDYDTRDGSCIRDYIHVMDIAHAHTLAMDYLKAGKQSQAYDVFNLGTGNGLSVLEMVKTFEEVTGEKLNWRIGPRRPGDVVAIYADNTKAQNLLGWQPTRNLAEMLRSAWAWEQRLTVDR